MTFTTRPLTQRDLDRMRAYHRGELQMPQWIINWNNKIEEAQRTLAAAVSQEALTPEMQQRYVQAIVKMMRRKEHLYAIWLDDLPFKTWDELAAESPPSAEDLFRYTVLDTEDYLNGPGVPAFVFFLNQKWDGILKDFAHQCLRECDPLLEEVLELTPEIRHHLSYPEQAFNTNNKDVLESRLLSWTKEQLSAGSPCYAQRLLVSNAMVALGNELGALIQMEFARCEAAAPDFPELMKQGDPRANQYLEQSQRWQVEVLLNMWPS